MGYGWQELLWSGFVATTLAAVAVWIPRSFALTRLDPTVQLGCLVLSDPRDPRTQTLGIVLLFALGTGLFPLVYGWLLATLGGPTLVRGLLVGGAHGALAVLALPAFGFLSACSRAGLYPQPGAFGLNWGPATPVVAILGHMIYGAVIAVILAAF
jgi:hypothetical protein